MVKKILCLCEKNGLAYNNFVRALRKNEGIYVVTENDKVPITLYDYAILFEPPKEKLTKFIDILSTLDRGTKRVVFIQDPHIPSVDHLYSDMIRKGYFHAIITTQKNACDKYKLMFNLPTLYCTWAINTDNHKDLNLKKKYDIGMAGSISPGLHPVRNFLINILEQDFSFFPIKEVKEKDVSKVYSSCIFGFNYSIMDDLNFRVFEVIGSGGILVTDNKSANNGLSDILDLEKDIIVYKDPAEETELKKDEKTNSIIKSTSISEEIISNLTKRLKRLLKNKKEQDEIRKRAYDKLIKNHTFEHRAKAILEFLDKEVQNEENK